MGSTTTPWGAVACAGAVLLTAAIVANLGDEMAAPVRAARAPGAVAQLEIGPEVATAAVARPGTGAGTDGRPGPPADLARPAPGGETAAQREALVPRASFAIAIGNHAKSMCDSGFEAGFSELANTFELSFARCRDREALELCMVDRVDMALIGGSLSARELAAGLRQSRIGLELFAIAVAPDFPVQSLSRSQIRQLLTGEIRNWQQLGLDRGPVVVIAPSQAATAERATREMILGDKITASAVGAAEPSQLADQLLRHRGALAVVRVRSTPPVGMKLLQVDWAPPTAAAFGCGTYPYGIPLQVVTNGEPKPEVTRFIGYAKSDRGRELLGRTLLAP